MIERLIHWWRIRTPRERVMLAVLGALAAAMLLWFAILLPLDRARIDARARYDAALDAEAAARAQAARLSAYRSARRAALPAPLETVVARAAEAAGFTGAVTRVSGRDRLAVTILSARPRALFAWLDQLAGQGIAVQLLALRPGAGGTVSVELTLSSGGRS